MRAYILAISLIAAPAMASQEMVATQGNDHVRIYDEPCKYAAVLQHVSPQARNAFRKATASIGGKSYFACWHPSGPQVALVYEDGDIGMIPAGEFKAVQSL